jgi:hypothetical protein
VVDVAGDDRLESLVANADVINENASPRLTDPMFEL